MSDQDLITKLSVIQAINRLGPHDMGLVNVDRVKAAVRAIEPGEAERKEEPIFMTCIGCNRDDPVKRDEICCSCLRGGHETDVDF